MLFTNNDDPHAANPDLKRQAATKAHDLGDIGITVDLLHMAKPGQRFDFKAFFASIVTFNDVWRSHSYFPISFVFLKNIGSWVKNMSKRPKASKTST
jgi:hypothetical protein